jgi:hypothetical protein
MLGKRALIAVLVSVVALVVVTGIMIIGPPSEERVRRIDARRVDDLQRIARSVEAHYSSHKQLPSSLEELAAEANLALLVPRDPVTAQSYGYRKINETSYELCGMFDRKSEESRFEELWVHGEGKQCFTRTIKP